MRITKETVFRGPNFLLPKPAIALLVVRPEGFAGLAAPRVSGCVERITQAIQSAGAKTELGAVDADLLHHVPAVAVGELVARTAAALQKEYFYAAEGARAFAQAQPDQVLVAYEFGDPELGVLAGRAAIALWQAVLGNPISTPQALQELYEAFKKRADTVAPVVETRLLLQEASRREIPWFRLGDNTPIYQLGQGPHRKRFHNSLSDETSDMAYRLASIKPLAAQLLRTHGLAVPRQTTTDTLEQAQAAAKQIGFPVVIKPINQDRGIGVRVGIASESELAAAYPATRAYGTVQVEKHLEGFDYRFTFFRGSLVGVLCTMPPIIVGDGKASIRQLLDAEPVTTATFARKKVIVDEEVLRRIADRGYGLSDVLPAGERIILRKWWRHQPDHMLENVTDITHRENIEAAALAVRLIGLDIAGVDYITTDIARPYYETGGAFTEVNPMPALAGVQRCGMPAYRLLLEVFFPPGSDGRIPTAVLLHAGDVTPTIVATEKLLAGSDYCIGVGTLGRFDIGGRPLRRPEADEGSRIRTVLADPRSTIALVQATPLTIGRDGLAIDRCDVGVVMMGEAEPAGGAATPEPVGLAAAALIGAIARKAIVLGTDDPRAPSVAASAANTPIIWVAPDLDGPPDHALLRPGDAVIALSGSEGGHAVTLQEAGGVQPIAMAPARLAGSRESDRQARRSYLTAIAIARGLGLSVAQIAEALRAPVAGAAASQASVERIS